MRKCPDWLDSFVEYGMVGEAPQHMLFWCGVSAIAGALQRKCWIDQATFKWFPNMYIVLVARPGIIAKTTTADLAIDFLKEVGTVPIGPNIATWQGLMKRFQKATTTFEYEPAHPTEIASLTICAGELGNFLDPDDRKCLDALNSFYDCKVMDKETLGEGQTLLERPFLNLLSCTTPAWINSAIPAYMLGGGFISRTIWVYGSAKGRVVAYPGRDTSTKARHSDLHRYLLNDLTEISTIEGNFTLTPEAFEWGEAWYTRHCSLYERGGDDSRLDGYYARKQAHVHKLAMVLSASRSSDRIIQARDLERAEKEVTALETNLHVVLDAVGKTEASSQSDRIVNFIKHHPEGVEIEEVQRYVRGAFPRNHDFEEVMKGLRRSRVVECKVVKGTSRLFITERTTNEAA